MDFPAKIRPNYVLITKFDHGNELLGVCTTDLECMASGGCREMNFRRVSVVAGGLLLFGHRSFEDDEVFVLRF